MYLHVLAKIRVSIPIVSGDVHVHVPVCVHTHVDVGVNGKIM